MPSHLPHLLRPQEQDRRRGRNDGKLRDDCTMLKPGVTEYEKPFVIGEFVNREAKEYTEAYDEVIMKAGGKK